MLAPHQLLDQLDAKVVDTAAEPELEASMPARQRSLRATMDWSLGLLPEPVLRLHRRVAVIAGSFAPSTAASILERGERRGILPLGIDVADGLRQLADASLLRSNAAAGEYELLSTVRADALDRLASSGEDTAMRWAHAYEVLALVEEAEKDFPTEHETDALDRLDTAHNDIREALEWSMDQGDSTFALRLAGSLAEFWRTRGHHTEGRLRLAAALAIGDDAPSPVRRKALGGAGLLASFQGDYGLAESYLREALAVAEADGDDEARAMILNWLGTNAYGGGDLDAAEGFVAESVALRRALGDPAGIATALNALGGVYHFRGNLDRARETFGESLQLKQGLGNENGIAVALMNLGLVERDAGRIASAEVAFTEAIDIWERTGDRQRVVRRHPQRRAARPRPRALRRGGGDAQPRLRHRPRPRRPHRDGLRAGRHGAGRGRARQPRGGRGRPRLEPPAVGRGRRADHRPAAARGGRRRSPRHAATTSSRSACGPPRRRSAPPRGS